MRTIALGGIAAVLAGCGQKGPLFHPTEPASAGRATLPQTLDPSADRPQPELSAPAQQR